MDLPREVHLIRTPTGIPVGPVNCYAIEGDPLTLIDSGMKSEKALLALRKGLSDMGRQLDECGQILLTHGHVDHAGLVQTICSECRRSGKEEPRVYIHERDRDRVADYDSFMSERAAAYNKVARNSGVPEGEMSWASPSVILHYFRRLGESIPSARPFDGHDSFNTGIGRLRSVEVPGHSPGSVCLVSDDRHIVFSGDHILSNISSNPSIDFDASDKISMLTYLESLRRMREYSGYLLLPGHRDFIPDVVSRINELENEYHDKLEMVAGLLGAEPKSVYTISRSVYGDYRFDQLVLALSETYDLLRILEQRGTASLVRYGDAWHASRVPKTT